MQSKQNPAGHCFFVCFVYDLTRVHTCGDSNTVDGVGWLVAFVISVHFYSMNSFHVPNASKWREKRLNNGLLNKEICCLIHGKGWCMCTMIINLVCTVLLCAICPLPRNRSLKMADAIFRVYLLILCISVLASEQTVNLSPSIQGLTTSQSHWLKSAYG